jgi:phospholipase/lecithinase/hemolysin
VLVRYGDFLKQLAADQKLGLADIDTPVVEALKKAHAADAANAAKILPDRVHPGAAGHLLLAEGSEILPGAEGLFAGVPRAHHPHP